MKSLFSSLCNRTAQLWALDTGGSFSSCDGITWSLRNGCWGWKHSYHFSTQLLTALPHLQTSEGSVNISTYVLSVNRFESCQHHGALCMLLSGSKSSSPASLSQSLLAWTWGEPVIWKRTRIQRRKGKVTFKRASKWESWLIAFWACFGDGIS